MNRGLARTVFGTNSACELVELISPLLSFRGFGWLVACCHEKLD